MCVYMCVCVSVYLYTYMYMYLGIHSRTHKHTHTHTHTHRYVDICDPVTNVCVRKPDYEIYGEKLIGVDNQTQVNSWMTEAQFLAGT